MTDGDDDGDGDIILSCVAVYNTELPSNLNLNYCFFRVCVM